MTNVSPQIQKQTKTIENIIQSIIKLKIIIVPSPICRDKVFVHELSTTTNIKKKP